MTWTNLLVTTSSSNTKYSHAVELTGIIRKRGVVGFFEDGRLSHNSSNLVEKESTTLHEIAAVFIGVRARPKDRILPLGFRSLYVYAPITITTKSVRSELSW